MSFRVGFLRGLWIVLAALALSGCPDDGDEEDGGDGDYKLTVTRAGANITVKLMVGDKTATDEDATKAGLTWNRDCAGKDDAGKLDKLAKDNEATLATGAATFEHGIEAGKGCVVTVTAKWGEGDDATEVTGKTEAFDVGAAAETEGTAPEPVGDVAPSVTITGAPAAGWVLGTANELTAKYDRGSGASMGTELGEEPTYIWAWACAIDTDGDHPELPTDSIGGAGCSDIDEGRAGTDTCRVMFESGTPNDTSAPDGKCSIMVTVDPDGDDTNENSVSKTLKVVLKG